MAGTPSPASRKPALDRVVILVLDGVGVGALPDAGDFGDAGSDTLGNTAAAVGGLRLANLERLGLGNCGRIAGVPPRPAGRAEAAFGRMAERSRAKDTLTGHWELAGLVAPVALRAYPDGFPAPVIDRVRRAVGRQVLGNVAASGTEIIQTMGEEHLRTGNPIVYTSADSVLQVAAHEAVIPVEELYRMCRAIRQVLRPDDAVGRVIARPFTGERAGEFVRTPRRRDYAQPPPGTTLLDLAAGAGLEVVAVGKVADIFAWRGVTRHLEAHDNAENVEAVVDALGRLERGLLFTNLVDFDTLWGHRNDPRGLARALEAFDAAVPRLVSRLRPRDLLMITADHGNDPTTPSTDHSREYVPLLALGPGLRSGVDLGTRQTFADVGATGAEGLGLPPTPAGTSFLHRLLPPSWGDGP